MIHNTYLQRAFDQRRCVSAWLGVGESLFLGFGEQVRPERDDAGNRTMPPFELQTNFADWSIAGPLSAATADADRMQLELAVSSLVNEQVIAWMLLPENELHLTFSGNKVLRVVPWDVSQGLADAWSVSASDTGPSFAVATNGQIGVFASDLPVRDWFRRSQA